MAPVLIFANPNGADTALATAAQALGKIATATPTDIKERRASAAGLSAEAAIEEKAIAALATSYETSLRSVTQTFQKQNPKATAEQVRREWTTDVDSVACDSIRSDYFEGCCVVRSTDFAELSYSVRARRD